MSTDDNGRGWVMIVIEGFRTFDIDKNGWSYRAADGGQRPIADQLVFVAFASDLGGRDGVYGSKLRETHVRILDREHGYGVREPIVIDPPAGTDHVELRVLCLEVEGDGTIDELAADVANGFEIGVGGHQPRPWHEPFTSFSDAWWTPRDARYRHLFEDHWSSAVAVPGVGGCEPSQTGRDGEGSDGTVGRMLAARGITRLVSLHSDGSTCHERRRYQNRRLSTDCALHVSYLAA